MKRTRIVLLMLAPLATASVALPVSSTSGARIEVGREAAARHDGRETFEMIRSLVGEWEAPMSNGVMVNVFRPIAGGSSILHEEWLNGEQITATVFYLVGSELRADHFCSLKNQVRYVATSTGPKVVTFEPLEVLNLESHPRHFRSTTWRFRDATRLTQDWQVVEHGEELRVVRLVFTRTK